MSVPVKENSWIGHDAGRRIWYHSDHMSSSCLFLKNILQYILPNFATNKTQQAQLTVNNKKGLTRQHVAHHCEFVAFPPRCSGSYEHDSSSHHYPYFSFSLPVCSINFLQNFQTAMSTWVTEATTPTIPDFNLEGRLVLVYRNTPTRRLRQALRRSENTVTNNKTPKSHEDKTEKRKASIDNHGF